MTVDLTQRLAGKTVIVTGGGSGLGKGAAPRIAAEGGAVTLADIRPADAKWGADVRSSDRQSRPAAVSLPTGAARRWNPTGR